MIIRLDRMGDQPFEWQESLQLSPGELEPSEQLLELKDGQCRGQIRQTSSGYLLHASLAFEQVLQCTRCLGTMVRATSNEVDLLFVVTQQHAAEQEKELTPEDLGIVFLPEPVLDTKPIWLEQLHLSIPMKCLCREDCAGLCSGCGADLNLGPCSCQSAVDSRWAALRDLKRP